MDAVREMPDGSGGKLIQKDSGWGDLNIGVPLKKYFNLDGKSGSWTFKPMVRIPLRIRTTMISTTRNLAGVLGLATSLKPQITFLALGQLGGFLMASDRPRFIPPWISAIILRPRIPTVPSSGKPIFTSRMMNPELLVQDLPSTSITTIRSIRGSNGSTTSLTTKALSTTAMETILKLVSVGFFSLF